MPAYSNALRARFGMPVWDIHTMSVCLMTSIAHVYKKNPNDHRLQGSQSPTEWPEFSACLDERGTAIVPRFGAKGEVLNYLHNKLNQIPVGKWDSYIPPHSEGFVGYGMEWNSLPPATLPVEAWLDTDGGFGAFKGAYPNPWREVDGFACYHPPPRCNHTRYDELGLPW